MAKFNLSSSFTDETQQNEKITHENFDDEKNDAEKYYNEDNNMNNEDNDNLYVSDDNEYESNDDNDEIYDGNTNNDYVDDEEYEYGNEKNPLLNNISNNLAGNNDKFIKITNKLNDIDNIKLNLRCDVGEVSLSLDQIANLSHGSVLDLAKLPPTVSLTLNNQELVQGILVEINGRLGVQIIN